MTILDERADIIREQLKELADENKTVPYGTFASIAREFHITRARVQQLAKALSISARARKDQV